MKNKKEILDFLLSNKELIQKQYHVTSIGLFGSFARNEQTMNSDVDLLIEMEKGTEHVHDNKEALKLYLSKVFNRSVDIAREKYLKPYAKENILKDTIYV